NKQKNQGRNNNDKQGWLKALRANENIKKYLKYKNGGDVTEGYENGELIVYFMDEHESECVGYYFELKENNKEYLKFIKYTLEQISAIFLAQWNGILAEYNGVFMKVANKSAQHEIAQIHAAMDNCNKSLGPIINMALFTKAEDLSKSYPKLPSHLIKYMKETSEYYSDMIDYTTMLSSVTLSAFAIDVDAELELKKFEPHKEFVNRLRNIYREELKSKSKKIYVIEGRNNPDYNSKQTHDDFEIIADPIKLEQAVNNIIRNAVKYSHAFTKIYLSAEQEGRDGKNGYTFTVTNFGLPIPKDPKNIDKPYDYIFNLGVRGYNSFEYLDKRGGIGFGLYIAREIAEKHGGNLFLEECFEICEYNIPLLDIYQKLSGERGFREEIAKKCKEYKEELEQKNDRYGSKKKIDIIIHKPPPNPVRAESEEDYFSSEKIDNNNDKVKFTPRYYMDRIKMPTARIRYKLWIPVNYNKEQEI
ncbi:MAG: ATP-binding protein, partial [Firmicutes bacterium]|nr:ATP-binding protein [Bacillota bacterium]